MYIIHKNDTLIHPVKYGNLDVMIDLSAAFEIANNSFLECTSPLALVIPCPPILSAKMTSLSQYCCLAALTPLPSVSGGFPRLKCQTLLQN